MASKRRNIFQKNKTQETTENGYKLVIPPRIGDSGPGLLDVIYTTGMKDFEDGMEKCLRQILPSSGDKVGSPYRPTGSCRCELKNDSLKALNVAEDQDVTGQKNSSQKDARTRSPCVYELRFEYQKAYCLLRDV
ncbi:hypothetical protein AAG570_003966 [Ranatra chinensis]|uniref:Uncharacterized protein n=1 Tax=Ranatra chinensis TaxID=642074 RepID=A0ABD0Y2I1_9HEMI